MVVDRKDVDEMERFRQIMEGKKPEPASNPVTDEVPFVLEQGPSKADISQMAGLLKIMETSANTVVKTANTDRTLKEALETKPLSNGAIIGNWSITKHKRDGVTNKKENYYKIFNPNTGEQINEEIFILEAAKALVKMLNCGMMINDHEVTKVIQEDTEYQRLRLKALHEKYNWHKVKNTDNEWKQDLFEAKFDAAKHHAAFKREQIKNIYLKL